MTTMVQFLRARLAEEETTAFAAIADRTQWVEDRRLPHEGPGAGSEPTRRPIGVPPLRPCHLETVANDDGVWRATYGRVYGVTLDTYDEGGITKDQAEHIALHDPAHVLREVEAKRRILDEYDSPAQLPAWDDRVGATRPWLEATIRSFAWVHADHRDYDQAWRS